MQKLLAFQVFECKGFPEKCAGKSPKMQKLNCPTHNLKPLNRSCGQSCRCKLCDFFSSRISFSIYLIPTRGQTRMHSKSAALQYVHVGPTGNSKSAALQYVHVGPDGNLEQVLLCYLPSYSKYALICMPFPATLEPVTLILSE